MRANVHAFALGVSGDAASAANPVTCFAKNVGLVLSRLADVQSETGNLPSDVQQAADNQTNKVDTINSQNGKSYKIERNNDEQGWRWRINTVSPINKQ